jgi:hypothetical protein
MQDRKGAGLLLADGATDPFARGTSARPRMSLGTEYQVGYPDGRGAGLSCAPMR